MFPDTKLLAVLFELFHLAADDTQGANLLIEERDNVVLRAETETFVPSENVTPSPR